MAASLETKKSKVTLVPLFELESSAEPRAGYNPHRPLMHILGHFGAWKQNYGYCIKFPVLSQLFRAGYGEATERGRRRFRGKILDTEGSLTLKNFPKGVQN